MTSLSIEAIQLLPPFGTYTITPTCIGSINNSFESSRKIKKSNICIGSINSWFESSRKEKKKQAYVQ